MPDTILKLADDARSLIHIDNEWSRPDENLPPPETGTGALLVSLDYWTEHRDALSASGARLGLHLPNTADVESLGQVLPHCALVELEFPAFTDGRAYSQARSLRERMQFSGDIRASGDVLSDQLLYMSRCGFTSFVFANAKVPEHVQKALQEFSVSYQPVHYGPNLKRAG